MDLLGVIEKAIAEAYEYGNENAFSGVDQNPYEIASLLIQKYDIEKRCANLKC